MIPSWLRTWIFWLHLVVGVLVSLVVVPMAITGAMLAFEREIVAWSDKDVKVIPAGRPRLSPSELLKRAATSLPPDVKPDTLQLERDPSAPASLETDDGAWLTDPYDGHVIRASRASRILAAAAEIHFTAGLVLTGLSFGSTVAGFAAIGMVLLSLSGPWLWWPRKITRKQFRRRLWFSPSASTAARDFTWHHVVGIWFLPMLLSASLTGVLIRFDRARDIVNVVFGTSPDSELLLDADSAAREIEARAPNWSAIRIWWPEKGGPVVRVRFADGVRPTQWATLVSLPPDGSGNRAVTLRRYQDGRTGDKLLGWARWLHTGQALGPVGQLVWAAGALGLVVLVWTGMALAFRRAQRALRQSKKQAPAREAA